MESLSSVIAYPTNRDGWLSTVLTGGILVFLGFLFVPLFLVYGYLVRVIRESRTGVAEPPVFSDWGQLFVDGLKAWIIGIIYMLVPILVATVTIGGALVSFATGGNVGATAGGLLAGLLISTLLALAFGYVAVAAIVNFAREDRLGAAFDFGVLRQVVSHRDYAVAWLLSILVLFVAGFVGSLPVIGWVLVPFVSFYALTVAGNLWSSGVAAALDSAETTDRVGGEQPTA